MPQLMPLSWCISFLLVSLFILSMVFLYYNKLDNNISVLVSYNYVILNWKW